MNLAMKLILTVLVVAALILGYLIYEKKTAPIDPVDSTTPVVTSEEPRNEKEASPAIEDKMSAQDSAILRDYLPANATADQKNAYFALVNKYAVVTNKLDITKCATNPFVTEIKQGEQLTLINNGTEPQTIKFDSTREYTAGPNSTKVLIADFGRGPGSYGFACPNKAGISGIVVVR
jgi:hypothetical protein